MTSYCHIIMLYYSQGGMKMQIDRLFKMVYLLMERERITAAELAERFEISVRTVYRDVDILSGAGIPIYTCKGRKGGICILPEFVLNRSLLSVQEQSSILQSLQSLKAIDLPEIEPVLDKLAAFFGKNLTSWLEVDFTSWSGEAEEKARFQTLKDAVIRGKVITFSYYNTRGEQSLRTVEPLKILFKGQGWYLYGFCHTRRDFRIFKLSRMQEISVTEERTRYKIPEMVEEKNGFPKESITVTLWMEASMAFRVYDEFSPEQVEKQPDGNFRITFNFPKGEWLYSFLLSFGTAARILNPPEVIDGIKQRLRKLEKLYF